MRVNDWRDTRYIDRVSVESVIMFYVAVGVYACLLVVNTFNLINTGITLRYVPHFLLLKFLLMED